MALPQYLAKLNHEQLKAATSLDGYNFVLAGAGSGKTSVLIARIAYMLDQNVKPENILLITFTNKAAKEMKDRVCKLLGDKGTAVTACTFHSFCANVLRKYASVLNLANDFIVLDDSDQETALNIAKDEYFEFCEKRKMPVDIEEFPTNKQILRIYAMVSNNSCPFERAFNEYKIQRSEFQDGIINILQRFAKYKAEHKAMDYDDLLTYTERLFRQNVQIRETYDKQFQYIMCDEYQDTNPVQNSIINLISQINPNLMVVGDDNQSIYAFRHADIQNILGFKDAHPGCKEFMLTENYRSTQEILDTANAMMRHATEGIEKRLHGQRHGKRPEAIKCQTARDEAEWIIRDILRRNVLRHDIAIMCRSGTQTYLLESMLNKYGIQYNKYGGMKFMEKAVIKDLLAFLRTLHSFKDEIAATRVLQLFSGVGAKTAKKLANGLASTGPQYLIDKQWENKAFYQSLYELKLALTHLQTLSLQDQLDYLVNDYYYSICERKILASKKKPAAQNEEIQKLRASREDAEVLMEMTVGYRSIASFLADVVLEATHKDEDIQNKLNITTIHSAKGLQYHTVYLMDCVEGITPRCEYSSKEEPEELRCMYVALTRAKERLVLMKPAYRLKGKDEYVPTKLSRFLSPQNVRDTFDVYSVRL